MIERTVSFLPSLTFLTKTAKQLCISEVVQISATIRCLKDAGIVVPIILPVNSPIWMLKNKTKKIQDPS